MSIVHLLNKSVKLKDCKVYDDLTPISDKYGNLIQFKSHSNHKILIGSLDIDKCRQQAEPDAPRWDYLIIINPDKEISLFIEIHPIVNTEITKVIKK